MEKLMKTELCHAVKELLWLFRLNKKPGLPKTGKPGFSLDRPAAVYPAPGLLKTVTVHGLYNSIRLNTIKQKRK
jgi:hypothetical protein